MFNICKKSGKYGRKLLRLMKSEGWLQPPCMNLGIRSLPISPISSPDAANRDTICYEKFCSVSRRSTLIGCCSDDETMYRSDETPIREQPVSPDLFTAESATSDNLPVPLAKPISPEIRIPSTQSIRIGSLPEILEIWHLLPCNESSSFIPIEPSKVLRRNRNKKPDRSSVLKFAGHG